MPSSTDSSKFPLLASLRTFIGKVRSLPISALLSALPLFNTSALVAWQQKATVSPHKLGVAMVRTYLTFRPSWEQEVLAERNDLLLVA